MNIFLIPSWYPTEESPMTGRFFREQALVYAKEWTQDRVIISRWGQGEFIVNLGSPVKALKKIYSYLQTKDFHRILAPNVIEFYSPAIEIRPRKYAGNLSFMRKKNSINFQKAQKKYGKIDVIHAHVAFPAGFIAMKLSEEFNIPYIITEHMGPFPFPFFLNSKQKLHHRLVITYQQASCVIAVSEFLKNEMASYEVKVHNVIPNFIDDDFFTSDIASCHDNGFVILVLARITKSKGIDIFLEAFAKAFSSQANIVAKVGGDGPDLGYLINLTEELGIASKVQFLGELDALGVKCVLQESSIVVNASFYETFSIVVSEALCAGKPVISTACGGPKQMLTSSNSITVDIGDTESMARAMNMMYNTIHLYNQVLIRDEHLLKFGKKTVTMQLREIYKRVIK